MQIDRQELTNYGGSPVEECTADVNDYQIAFRPERQHDKHNLHSSSLSIRSNTGKNVDSLFYNDTNNGIQAYCTNSYGNGSYHEIKKQHFVAVGKMLDIPAEHIHAIATEINHGKTTSFSIEFNSGLDKELLNQDYLAFAKRLEAQKLVSAGTVYELDKEGVIDAGVPKTTLNHKDQIEEIFFEAIHNSTGQKFSVRPNHGANHTWIHLGELDPKDFGYVIVTHDKYRAAEKLAEILGIPVDGKKGRATTGANLRIDKPLDEVIAHLKDAGVIRHVLDEALQTMFDGQRERRTKLDSRAAVSRQVLVHD